MDCKLRLCKEQLEKIEKTKRLALEAQLIKEKQPDERKVNEKLKNQPVYNTEQINKLLKVCLKNQPIEFK